MANITLTAGTLTPPACYANDQERLVAFVAAISAAITGGVQWEAQQSAPADLASYWLQLDANGRPRHIRKYAAADGKWQPPIDLPYVPDSVGGTGDVITFANSPTFNSGSCFLTGRRFVFLSTAANTGPVTLNVDGLGAKDLVKQGDTPLAAGDITAGQIVDVIYNLSADQFEMQTPPAEFVLTGTKAEAVYTTGTASCPNPSSSVTIAHNKGAVPKVWFIRLRCGVTAQAGYTDGNEADPVNFHAIDNEKDKPAFVITADTTNFTIGRHPGNGTSANKLYAQNKTAPSNTQVEVTPANWTVVAYWL